MVTLGSKPLWCELLRQENLVCGLSASGRDDALAQLCLLLATNAKSPESAQEWLSAVIAREKVMPTVLAPGLAMPHARIQGLAAPLLAVAGIPGGLEFGTKTPQPVKLVILLLTPGGDPQLHLKIIKDLAAAFIKRSPEELGTIAAAQTCAELLERLSP